MSAITLIIFFVFSSLSNHLSEIISVLISFCKFSQIHPKLVIFWKQFAICFKDSVFNTCLSLHYSKNFPTVYGALFTTVSELPQSKWISNHGNILMDAVHTNNPNNRKAKPIQICLIFSVCVCFLLHIFYIIDCVPPLLYPLRNEITVRRLERTRAAWRRVCSWFFQELFLFLVY